MSFRKILLFIFCSLATLSHSQVTYREIYTTWEAFLEHFCDDGDLSNEDVELLSFLKDHPINLNTTDKESLLQLPFISEQQIDSLLAYREKKKLFMTLGELQFISGWDALSRRFTSLFTYVGDTLKPSLSVTEMIKQGSHTLESRLDIPTYKRKGDLQQTGGYLGDNLKNVTRYHFSYNNELEFGATFEKDAGEPFASQGNNPFDHNSIYLKYTTKDKRHKILLGDYTLHVGEGLMLGKNSFSGQLSLLDSPSRHAVRLNTHKSTDEQNYYRGAAYSFTFSKLRLTSFASYRSLDAKIEGNKAVTLYTDGMHRTYTELTHKNTLNNATFGFLTELKLKNSNWELGGYISHYDKDINPQPKTYNRYAFTGKIASGASLTYKFNQWKRLNLSGELSADQRLHLAFSHRMHYKTANNINLSAQLRWLSKRYTAPFAHTINFASRVANEQGLLVGAKWTSAKKLNFETYIDIHRFPFSTYRAEKPSLGLKSYIQISKETSKTATSTLRYTFNLWQENLKSNKDKLNNKGKHRLRIQHAINSTPFIISGLIEGCMTHSQTDKHKYGITAALRGNYQFSPFLSVAAFGAVFTTDDYASSVYAYEPLLPSMSSFGALYYKGFRIAAQTKYTWKQRLTLGVRYSITHYFNKATIGSSLQTINNSTKGDINIYLKFRIQ